MADKKGLTAITPEEFTLKAIKALRQEGRKGIHTVYSGFNAAYRKQFPGEDPVIVTTALAKAGKVSVRMCRGGAVMYLPGDAPAVVDRGDSALKLILA